MKNREDTKHIYGKEVFYWSMSLYILQVEENFVCLMVFGNCYKVVVQDVRCMAT